MKYIPLFLLCFFAKIAYAQSISQQLGAITTEFIIYYQGKEVDIQNQIIVEKGIREHFADAESGFGYGLRTFHLEFTSTERLPISSRRRNKFPYKLTFYNAQNEALLSIRMRRADLVARPGKLNAYYLNLQDIPLLILDQTRSIWFELQE